MNAKEEIEMKPLIGEKKKLEPVSFKTLFRYATATDIFMMVTGCLSALASGGAFPLTTVVFGKSLVLMIRRFDRCIRKMGTSKVLSSDAK